MQPWPVPFPMVRNRLAAPVDAVSPIPERSSLAGCGVVDPAVVLCGFPKPHKLLWTSYKYWEFPIAVLNRRGHSCDWSRGYRWAENQSWPSFHEPVWWWCQRCEG